MIKIALISIPADQDAWHPVRRSAHDVAEALYGDLRAAFDDHLIMDMTYNLAEGQVPHSKAQEIPGDCLNDVLHEFRTVRFDTFPFLRGADSLGELSTGGKGDEEHAAFVGEAYAADFGRDPLPDCCLYGIIYIPPKLYDVWISLTPGVD